MRTINELTKLILKLIWSCKLKLKAKNSRCILYNQKLYTEEASSVCKWRAKELIEQRMLRAPDPDFDPNIRTYIYVVNIIMYTAYVADGILGHVYVYN